jgi:hypothetical protein
MLPNCYAGRRAWQFLPLSGTKKEALKPLFNLLSKCAGVTNKISQSPYK